MTNANAVTKHASEHTGGRSQTPPSAQLNPSSSRAAKIRQALPTSAAAPVRTLFDPWNSSSTGHQRAENRLSGSPSWRDSRNLKLNEQHRGGLAGGAKRVADTVGAGSEDFGDDGRKANGGWERGAKGLRTHGQKSLVEFWGASKSSEKVSPKKDVLLSFPSSEEARLPETIDDSGEHHQDRFCQ